MNNVREYVSGSPETTELRKTSNSTANAFVTVTYSYEIENEVLRSFFPTRARRCHFCIGISQKSRDCDRIMDQIMRRVFGDFSTSTREFVTYNYYCI